MVNLNVVEDSISVSIGEDFSVVPYNKVTYKRLFDLSVQANAAESFEEYEMYTHGIVQIVEDNGIDAQQLIESKCSYLKYNELTKQYFLTHDDERQRIAAAGFNKTRSKDYSYDRMLEVILSAVQDL